MPSRRSAPISVTSRSTCRKFSPSRANYWRRTGTCRATARSTDPFGPSRSSRRGAAILHRRRRRCVLAEVLVEFPDVLVSTDGRTFAARAVGEETTNGMWHGWIEFLTTEGNVLASGRETTQPNRQDTL